MAAHGTRGGDAFGLHISSAVPVPGLEPLPRHPERMVCLRVAHDHGALGRRSSHEILYRAGDGEPPQMLIDRRPGGYGIWSPRAGRYLISADGTEIVAALPQRSSWPWELLFAQALPIAAAIRGLEVLHASAVAIDGAAIAITAASGHGKSTLAAALIRGGAEFVADDVVALEATPDGVVAHPGAPIVNASEEGLARGVAHERVVGRTAKHHVVVRRVQGSLPLRALVFLERLPAGSRARVVRVLDVDPAWLLGSTFVFVVRAPQRLVRQLDIHQAIAASVRVLHARLPWTEDPQWLAETLTPHLL